MGRGLAVGIGLGVAVGGGVTEGVGVGVGDGWPPFVVRRIMPPSPTAMPLNASLANETSWRFAELPLVCSVQVVPVSMACRILPPEPTANPLAAVGKSTPSIA